MTVALAFDIYGTLIDPHGVVSNLQNYMGDKAIEFSRIWREKQLEYSWRRGLMNCYQDFGVCTRDALNYADQFMHTHLDDSAHTQLMQVYRELPAFSDVSDCLERLRSQNCRLFPFSNGTVDMVEAVLDHADIKHLFEPVISVDSINTFKPDPAVYHHVIEVTAVEAENCWLVSSNCFDVIGAVSAGMKAVWLQRSEAMVFDPWEIRPTGVIRSLDELSQLVS